MKGKEVKFFVGQIIDHRLFHYRGVIVGVDAEFSGTEAWYEAVAKSRPPKDEPWYHVLVHNASHMTYVAQQNLKPGSSAKKIQHPQVSEIFDRFETDRYILRLH